MSANPPSSDISPAWVCAAKIQKISRRASFFDEHQRPQRCDSPSAQAIGVIRNVKKTSYTQLYEDQMDEQKAIGKYKCVDDLLNSGDTWEV